VARRAGIDRKNWYWFLAGALSSRDCAGTYQQLAPTTAQGRRAAGVAPGTVNPNGISIAVLPSEICRVTGQEFFSDA